MAEKSATRLGEQAGCGATGSATNASICYQDTASEPKSQGPGASFPVYVKDGLIWCAGRHLCAARDGVLSRTMDFRRELLYGGVYFREDVLRLAQDAGCREIVITERTGGARYRVSLATFLKRGRAYGHPAFGKQLGLALVLFEWLPPPNDVRQLVLWGGR